jgi:hypothetical protein
VPPFAAGLAFGEHLLVLSPAVVEAADEDNDVCDSDQVVDAINLSEYLPQTAKAATVVQAALPLAEYKEQLVAERQVVYTAKRAAGAFAGRKPKLKAKLKALLELAAKAKVEAEVLDVFFNTFSASDDDEDLQDLFVDLVKMVKLYSARGHCRSCADKLAALHDCLGSL